ncbi:Uncharacterised protein [Yersinia pseudotuberculosis]|nr:Uncharacterised protein [Yersinia pseudotuberculosis]
MMNRSEGRYLGEKKASQSELTGLIAPELIGDGLNLITA